MGAVFFSPNCFLLYGGTVNQVFHGFSCVLGSSQSVVEQSNILRGFTETFRGCGLSYHIGLEAGSHLL